MDASENIAKNKQHYILSSFNGHENYGWLTGLIFSPLITLFQI